MLTGQPVQENDEKDGAGRGVGRESSERGVAGTLVSPARPLVSAGGHHGGTVN